LNVHRRQGDILSKMTEFAKTVQPAISVFKRSGPILSFSFDLTTLHTVGCFMDMVTWEKDFSFTTDRGYSGHLQDENLIPNIDGPCFLVALFGIRAPFVLKQVSLDQTYEILDLAEIHFQLERGYFRHWGICIEDASTLERMKTSLQRMSGRSLSTSHSSKHAPQIPSHNAAKAIALSPKYRYGPVKTALSLQERTYPPHQL
jgi:hypothetical protein